ncbi:MAG: glycosyltransferase [Deltaproteobacteria bacterium]
MTISLDELTIILPTRNEARNIARALASLPPEVALIVVDASSDETPNIISEARARNTTVIKKSCSVTEARQIGADAAGTDWLLFTDADIVFAPRYFENLESGGADLIYGPKLSRDEFSAYYRWFARGQGWLQAIGVPAASGSNLIVRRCALASAGGFDLRLPCNEDSEAAWRVARAGFKTRFAPDLIVYASDHRRLSRGAVCKTMHSLARCALLYLNLMPSRWRGHDWGYWKHRREEADNGIR